MEELIDITGNIREKHNIAPLLEKGLYIMEKKKFGNPRRNHWANPVVDDAGYCFGGLTSNWANDCVTKAAEDAPRNNIYYEPDIFYDRSWYKKPPYLYKILISRHLKDVCKKLREGYWFPGLSASDPDRFIGGIKED